MIFIGNQSNLGLIQTRLVSLNRIKMRFTVVLVFCFLGVASASSLHKRSFFDDLKNKTQTTLHDFEQFGQTFNGKIQDALKNLFDAFKNSTSNGVSVTKRATNPLQLVNDLGDPAKFAQDLLKVHADIALQGRRKRDVFEDIQKFSESAQQKAQEALQKIFDLFEQLTPQTNNSAVNITKRATNPLELINDLSHLQDNPAKFAQDLLKILAEMALQGRRKRDVSEDLQKFSEAAKQNAQEGLRKIFDFIDEFKQQFASDSSDDKATVTKRDVSDIFENFRRTAQEKSQEAFNNIRQTLENLFKGNPFFQSISNDFDAVDDVDEISTEGTIVKRNIFENFDKFSRNTLAGLKQAIQNLSNAINKPHHPHHPQVHESDDDIEEEISTERTIVKRNIFGDIHRFNQNLLNHFLDSLEKILDQSKRPFAPQSDDIETATISV